MILEVRSYRIKPGHRDKFIETFEMIRWHHRSPNCAAMYSIAIADLNGDGHADVLLGNLEAPGAVLINDGTGRRFTLVRFGDKQGAVYGLALGDVNGDGSPDIVAARSDAPNMLYLNSLVMKAGPKSPVRPN